MNKEDAKEIINTIPTEVLKCILSDEVVSSKEVVEMLGITTQRLYQMKSTGKLEPFKKGVYLKREVEERLKEQENLRDKYLK